jgi:hypothetical protein
MTFKLHLYKYTWQNMILVSYVISDIEGNFKLFVITYWEAKEK